MINRTKAVHYHWGDQCDGWHLVQAAGLSVIQERMPPGKAEVRHYHQTSRQFFFILKGVATMEVEGQIETLHAHDGIEIAPGAPHQIFNTSTEDVEFLVISQPPSRGDRFSA